ncbi:hypothetical protein Pmani_002732 [Petrolisthes manimaculis]|uniref:Uncharacterized protein n=1 Tax=Petrolisthes manimaculis TaxID=1843537 RepID=A0AAE1QJQ9_9EUCA|nr:hypothetical protein Pmani_002732 [Petrolisthes manimaculis]
MLSSTRSSFGKTRTGTSLTSLKLTPILDSHRPQFVADTQSGDDGYPTYRRRKPAEGGFDAVITMGKNRQDKMARYISSNEAAWKLFKFSLHERYLTVVHLAVHLENGQLVIFNPNNPQQLQQQVSTPRPTTLTAFFYLCSHDQFASSLLYHEVPQFYTWQLSSKV